MTYLNPTDVRSGIGRGKQPGAVKMGLVVEVDEVVKQVFYHCSRESASTCRYLLD